MYGLRFLDKERLPFRNLVQVPKVWSVFIGASFLIHVPQVSPFFILLEFCASVDNSAKLSTISYTLCSGFYQNPLMGFKQIFPLVLMQSQVQHVSSLKHFMKSTTKKEKRQFLNVFVSWNFLKEKWLKQCFPTFLSSGTTGFGVLSYITYWRRD